MYPSVRPSVKRQRQEARARRPNSSRRDTKDCLRLANRWTRAYDVGASSISGRVAKSPSTARRSSGSPSTPRRPPEPPAHESGSAELAHPEVLGDLRVADADGGRIGCLIHGVEGSSAVRCAATGSVWSGARGVEGTSPGRAADRPQHTVRGAVRFAESRLNPLPLKCRGSARVCPTNGVSGGSHYRFSAAGIRSAKVTAKAFRAGFHRVTHRDCPVPLGSRDRVTR